jgi:hypothetical protein
VDKPLSVMKVTQQTTASMAKGDGREGHLSLSLQLRLGPREQRSGSGLALWHPGQSPTSSHTRGLQSLHLQGPSPAESLLDKFGTSHQNHI